MFDVSISDRLRSNINKLTQLVDVYEMIDDDDLEKVAIYDDVLHLVDEISFNLTELIADEGEHNGR